MEHVEVLQETISAMPIIPRLDRIDLMLQLLEGKHSLSRRELCSNICEKREKENECKSLCAAVDEVQHKGTIMERLSMLENRLLQVQLSLEMEEGNTSKSSSSSLTLLHNIGKESDQKKHELLAIIPRETKDQHVLRPKDGDSFSIGELATKRTSQQNKTRPKKKPNKKWLGLLQFRLRC
ncbi:uncharacterized protein [Primulina eburnea]|uniref:uncharacterized protein isoform X1 n=1 Tax=Primulina eburnea TaxID=1245227 RepID=UPI003C6C0A72